MNKKLLTLAVAAALTAPTAAMAEAILYGKLNVSIDYVDIDSVQRLNYYPATTTVLGTTVTGFNSATRVAAGLAPYPLGQWSTTDYKGWSVNGNGYIPRNQSRASRIGVKGSEDLGNGLKAIYQVEFGVQLAEESNSYTSIVDPIDGASYARMTGSGNVVSGSDNQVSMRNSFVGLASGFGTILVGRHDTPLKISTGPLDLFADTLADFNGTVGFQDLRADNVVAYISPNMGGFQLMGAVNAGGGETAGSGPNLNSDSISEAYSIAGIYKNGPFYASLAYESLGKDLFMNTNTSVFGTTCLETALTCSPGSKIQDDWNKWRVGLGLLDWNGLTLTGIYEEQDGIPMGQYWDTWQLYDATGAAVSNPYRLYSSNTKLKLWQIQAGYSFGNNMVKAMYGSGNRDGRVSAVNNPFNSQQLQDAIEGDYFTWAIAFDHNFSKRTKVYALYTEVADDADYSAGAYGTGSWSGFSMGMSHSF